MLYGAVGRVGLRSSVAPFTPALLFAANEPGVWYDPSDMTTLFQDAAGTTPVTAMEQPVGLVLDKSRGLTLGSELVTNGDFSNGTTGWAAVNSASISAASGELVVTNTTAAYGIAYQAVTTVVGKTYKASCIARVISGNAASFQAATAITTGLIAETFTASSTATAISFVFTATSTTTYIRAILNNVSGYSAGYDNISVRELPGNHASQTTAASRPVLSARYNLLTQTEDFSYNGGADQIWSVNNVTVDANVTTAPNRASTADFVKETTANGYHGLYGSVSVIAGSAGTHRVLLHAKANGRDKMKVALWSGGGAIGTTIAVGAEFDLTAKTATAYTTGGSYISTSPAIIELLDGWFACAVTVTIPNMPFVYYTVTYSNGSTYSYTGDTTKGMYLWGADLRHANDGVGLPSYQRVGAAVNATTNPAVTGVPDYDTTGFPVYLRFDGVDDSLSTASIDFTSTDKMSVFAGVRKLSDPSEDFIVTIGANSSANGFELLASTFFSSPKGFGIQTTPGYAAGYVNNVLSPTTKVVFAKADRGQSTVAATFGMRLNGVDQTLTNANTLADPTGNFSNTPLYVGIRAGPAGYLNGRLYSLIVRGAATDAATSTSTDTWVNGKTAAY